MIDDLVGALADAYLEELSKAGIVLRRDTAESTIRQRADQFARSLGLSFDAGLGFYAADTMRSWAREAAAQLHDEQPDNPLLADAPTRFAPVDFLARCIDALVGAHPALAQRTAANLFTYPAILLGGLSVVRCQRADLELMAAVLAGSHPDLSRRCSLLAGPAA